MDIEKYISSGILELYVCGGLSEEESREVSRIVKEYPEVRKEVEEIEEALRTLTQAAAPTNPQHLLGAIKKKRSPNDQPETKVRRLSWVSYIGWAASLILFIGLFLLLKQNNDLRSALASQQAKNAFMESKIAEARSDLEKTQNLLNILRDKEINRVPLKGQNIKPGAYASVYWNQKENKAYIDARGLPNPPEGMVYQVWSLKLQPLTPTSIGLLENFEEDDNKVFSLENTNDSEAFGITLEPEGGSDSPTMEQLFVLGTVASS